MPVTLSNATSPISPLSIAIVGMGTVGTGVAKVLLEQSERIARRAGRPIQLRHAVVNDLKKPREIELPPGILTDNVRRVIDDRETQIAIHLVGGIHPAKEIMISLLESGKDVVTANKALLCEHGPELFARARELGRSIAFEAAVAGGIPIIATVSQCMAGNQITSISGILNGTTNFILTEMIQRDQSYAVALRRAQELGYAEADPTMDVDGTDAAQKLVILTQLAFGTKVKLDAFPRRGIDKLDLGDIRYAAELGYTVKLLAVSKLVGNRLEVHVSPTLVKKESPLAQVHGAFNAVALTGDVVGDTWYSGRGAGQLPTASAVLADLIDMAVGRAQLTFERLGLWNIEPQFELLPQAETSCRYYLRFNIEDRPHVLADIADVLGRHDISIASVIQHEAPETASGDSFVPLVIMTHKTTAGHLDAARLELAQLTTLRPPLVELPVAG
ncbi:MAG: Homoserine dehydrogenase [Planctomycetaceae bacterium]|nr:Homoserine dehydrogenase [Planctomycetaceae bacterium]